jgi:hypothetical protein
MKNNNRFLYGVIFVLHVTVMVPIAAGDLTGNIQSALSHVRDVESNALVAESTKAQIARLYLEYAQLLYKEACVLFTHKESLSVQDVELLSKAQAVAYALANVIYDNKNYSIQNVIDATMPLLRETRYNSRRDIKDKAILIQAHMNSLSNKTTASHFLIVHFKKLMREINAFAQLLCKPCAREE